MPLALLTLVAVGTVSLAVTLIAGYQVPADPLRVKAHFVLALGATTLLVMGHSFVMFYLLATGSELKELERERGWGDAFRRRTRAMKSQAFPAATLALGLSMAQFILGAAVHTRALPAWTHEVLAWATLAVSLWALWSEHRALDETNRMIAEAAERRGRGAG